MAENGVMTNTPNEVHLDDYQYRKTPDVWSQALWLGAALDALKTLADQSAPIVVGEEDKVAMARLWLDRVPVEVKAAWPGVFDPESQT